MTPTSEQSAILSAVAGSNDNLTIRALAGTGKTSTFVLICNADRVPTLALAFNKRNATDLQERMPPHVTCKTLSGLGYGSWGALTGKRRLVVNDNKDAGILKELLAQLGDDEARPIWENLSDMLKAIKYGKECGWLPEAGDKRFTPLLSDPDFFHRVANHDQFGWDLSSVEKHLLREVAKRSVALAWQGTIDFADMLLLPTICPSASFPTFDRILVDEAQDLSLLNHAMLRKIVKRKRLIVVGDPCQPDGTMITVVEKKGDAWHPPILRQVPIEEISIDDTVLGYDPTGSFIFNRKVEGITRKPYEGDLIEVVVDGNVSRYTPNHHCYANFKPLEGQTAVYLMRRGADYRIGRARFGYDEGCGPVMRARAENADALWVLGVYENTNAALVEAWAQAHFGLPDLTFISPGTNEGLASQFFLDTFWGMMAQTNLNPRAQQCLEHFGRLPEYPFWEKGAVQVTARRPTIVRACNLISGCLMLPYRGKKSVGRTDWHSAEIGRTPYSGQVTSFTISDNHLYVADNLVTHNCQAIYGFRGAHQDSMTRLAETFTTRELLLSVSFRCARSVAEHVRWRAPDIKSPEWAAEGQVSSLETWGPETLPAEAAIICRNNAPLFGAAMRLLISGRRPKIIGNDITQGLVKDLKKLGKPDLPQEAALAAFDLHAHKLRTRYKNSAFINDKLACMSFFLAEAPSLGLAIANAERILTLEGPIQLLTGHKSKGMEYENVFFLDEHLIDSNRGGAQEDNLRYVICTRAKCNLTYITSAGWSGEGVQE